MYIAKLSNEEKLKCWKRFHKLHAEGLKEGDFAKKNFAQARIKELWPYRHEFMATQGNTVATKSQPKATQVQPNINDNTSRFSFYISPIPCSRLTTLCDEVFTQWLTFRGCKRQVPAEMLSDYKTMIACILSNLAYSGTVRVSRDKADFSKKESHYRPKIFNKRFLTIMDDLEAMGVLAQSKGKRYTRNQANVFDPTKKKYLTKECLLTRIGAGAELKVKLEGLTRQDIEIHTEHQEVVMLKKDEGSDLVEYEETPRTMKYRKQVKIINDWLERAGSLLTDEGEIRFDNRARFLVRKFTYNNFEKGGRLWGGCWDSPMKKTERSTLLRIQGRSTAEVDYESVNIHLAYALHGEEPPRQADRYSIPGLHPESRPGIKKFINAHLFREGNRQRFPKNEDGKSIIEDFHISDRSKSYGQVLALIEKVHPALVHDFFGTGVGHHLQFLESQLMVNVLLRCAQKRIVCLPLHDALVVREDQAERVAAIMEGTSMSVLGRVIPVSVKGQKERVEAA